MVSMLGISVLKKQLLNSEIWSLNKSSIKYFHVMASKLLNDIKMYAI